MNISEPPCLFYGNTKWWLTHFVNTRHLPRWRLGRIDALWLRGEREKVERVLPLPIACELCPYRKPKRRSRRESLESSLKKWVRRVWLPLQPWLTIELQKNGKRRYRCEWYRTSDGHDSSKMTFPAITQFFCMVSLQMFSVSICGGDSRSSLPSAHCRLPSWNSSGSMHVLLSLQTK